MSIGIEEKDWNFNMAWLKRLDTNLTDCDTLAKQGNTDFLFRALKIVYMQIHYRMQIKGSKQEEDTEATLTKKFSEAEVMFRAGTINVGGAKQKAEIMLWDILQDLNDLVWEYGFLQLKSKKVDVDTGIEDEMG